MNKKPKKIMKLVRLLEEGTVNFVSLVSHGANQTPFRIVKSAIVNFNKPSEAKAMKRSPIAVKQFRFDKKAFATPDDVVRYMSVIGHESVSVEDRETFYVVDNEAMKDKVPVEEHVLDGTDQGVSVLVAKYADDEFEEDLALDDLEDDSEDDLEDDTEEDRKTADSQNKKTKKAPRVRKKIRKEGRTLQKNPADEENKKKFSLWGVWESTSTSFARVLKAGDNGLPIGIWEVTEVMLQALKNSLLAGEKDNIVQITQEYSKAVVFLSELVGIFGVDDSEITTQNNQQKETKPMENQTDVAQVPTMEELQKANKELQDTVESLNIRIKELETFVPSKKSGELQEEDISPEEIERKKAQEKREREKREKEEKEHQEYLERMKANEFGIRRIV